MLLVVSLMYPVDDVVAAAATGTTKETAPNKAHHGYEKGHDTVEKLVVAVVSLENSDNVKVPQNADEEEEHGVH